MNALTLRELELRRAQLAERATRLEAEWRRMPTGAKATATGKEVAALKERAEDYQTILDVLKLASGKEATCSDPGM